ncbi:hypothetical protein ACFWBS_44490 [Streptomyces mirabilis]|uniref:hypothetical protein n=1 Tax=Streptomyces mirabilis TaxID=68239 RepID=UPI0036490C81
MATQPGPVLARHRRIGRRPMTSDGVACHLVGALAGCGCSKGADGRLRLGVLAEVFTPELVDAVIGPARTGEAAFDRFSPHSSFDRHPDGQPALRQGFKLCDAKLHSLRGSYSTQLIIEGKARRRQVPGRGKL